MLTLEQTTTILKAAGVRSLRMTRSYKRRDHREVLLEGVIDVAGAHRERQDAVKALLTPLARQIEFTMGIGEMWSWSQGVPYTKLEMFCKVENRDSDA